MLNCKEIVPGAIVSVIFQFNLNKHFPANFALFMNPIFPENSGVTLLFEHSLSRASEIDYFEIFSCLQGNQLA